MDVVVLDEPASMTAYVATLARIPSMSLTELAEMREPIMTFVHRLDVPKTVTVTRSPMPAAGVVAVSLHGLTQP